MPTVPGAEEKGPEKLPQRERKKAKHRQGTRTDKHGGNLPQSLKGKTRDKVARTAGVSGNWQAERLEKSNNARLREKRFNESIAASIAVFLEENAVKSVFLSLGTQRKQAASKLPNRGPDFWKQQ